NKLLENKIGHLSEICQMQSCEIIRLLNENNLLNQICQIQSSQNHFEIWHIQIFNNYCSTGYSGLDSDGTNNTKKGDNCRIYNL
ncbi:38695_t:CDS:1, partial [Gigaspora margarita]